MGISTSSTDIMGFLIQDLLDYAQIKSDKFRTNIDQFNIVDAVKKVMDVQRKQAKDRGIDLISDFQNVVGNPIIVCDEQRIKQVLLGLQSNALKFTERGFVKIIVERNFQSEKEFLKITVEDSGIGIEIEDQDKLFKLFGFLQDNKKLNTKGVGMGLVISDQIVQKFSGRVTFSSIPGVGSTFIFTFELSKKAIQNDNDDESFRYMLDQKELYYKLTHLDGKIEGFKLNLDNQVDKSEHQEES